MNHAHARGMTLVELLLALGLLSAVVVAMLSWTSVAAGSAGSAASRMRWEQAARAILQRIAEDLASGDFESERRGDSDFLTLDIGQESLSITTRTADRNQARVYRLQEEELRVQQAVLLKNVAQFTTELDAEDRILSITLVHAGTGRSTGRLYRLP